MNQYCISGWNRNIIAVKINDYNIILNSVDIIIPYNLTPKQTKQSINPEIGLSFLFAKEEKKKKKKPYTTHLTTIKKNFVDNLKR